MMRREPWGDVNLNLQVKLILLWCDDASLWGLQSVKRSDATRAGVV